MLRALVLMALLGAPVSPEISIERPPPLKTAKACTLWVGEASGNDPSVRVEVLICPGVGNQVVGRLQWSSTLSGWNLRDLVGTITEDKRGLRLKDVQIRENRPAPGWIFCPADIYEFHLEDADHLNGTYDSAACRDHAVLALRRKP